MKNTSIFLLVCLFFQTSASAQKSNCSRNANFGKTPICLPKVAGYQECYLEPMVKELADATEMPTNVVLGYYLNDRVFSKRDSLGLIDFDDYFKVYATKQVQDLKADQDALKQVQDMFTSNFITKNWDSIEKDIDGTGLEVSIEAPTIIKTYQLDDRSFTSVMLTKYALEDGTSYTLAMTISGMLLKERLIWLAYYVDYTGAESVARVQKNSNAILQRVLAENR